MVTSNGLAGLLQCRAISPVIKAHSSAPLCRLDTGDRTSASLKVCKSASDPRDSGGATPGGGDMFRGLGDNLHYQHKYN